MTSIDIDSLMEEGRNKTTIFCTRCPSKILSPKIGVYVTKPIPLPHMHNDKTETVLSKNEDVVDFWRVDDMYSFENIGFSKTVDQQKYLICADCEIGPIGWHDLTEKSSYVAVSRVKHQ